MLFLTAAACENTDKKSVTVTRERSQAVAAANAPSAPATPTAASAPAPAAAAPAAPRQLCAGQMNRAGQPFPKLELGRAAAPGEREPAAKLAPEGNWTWVNFWAAWCVPCKEEIPRLRSWERKLNAAGTSFALVFVSLDDDPRQLQTFLATQPADGLRSTYWLREGEERERWLVAATVDPDPELPAHLLVDPKGKIRCVVKGAVEDRDYEQLVSLLK